ncbi:MAG: SDR family NAD(P)-dependent oxidoreductase [Erythrobacter sp.]|jgi:NAD(P)-dependent dehydrogenase (short-subunit alcohol dehydrogenase family)|nr:SDR family NAD(P)-dependent oxidoreductase [Erythrobacter sp.]
MNQAAHDPGSVAIFGSTGGIGAAMAQCLAGRGYERIDVGSRDGMQPQGAAFRPFAFDLQDEASIAAAAAQMKDDPPQWVIVATGVLTLPDGSAPERTYKRLDRAAMTTAFAFNAIGPALIAKHMLAIMPRGRPFKFAALSARIGSISDNGVGGWHSYRASKAALNMLLKNFAIEMARTHEESVIVGLHPGTVDSKLSRPFQSNLPDGQLTDPSSAADNLVGVLARLEPCDSGKVFDYAGEEIPA